MGTFTWDIGNMRPNENQTLTYRIKMKPGFIGSGETKEMDNTATVYMDDVEKNHDTASYLSSDTATVTKNYTGSYYMPNSSNEYSTGYIFRTKVTADARNENALTNVVIMDSLEDAFGVTGNSDETRSHYRYIAPSSWQITYSSDGRKVKVDSSMVTFSDPDAARHNGSFTLTLPEPLQPGETATPEYVVYVDPGITPEIGSSDTKLINIASASLDGGNTHLATPKAELSLSHETRTRKLNNSVTFNSKTFDIPSGDAVYQYHAADDTVSEVTSGRDSDFTVPQGSYLYQVIANEKKSWDITSAAMKDDMGEDTMAYVGYVRMDAFDVSPSGNTDAEKIDSLAGQKPAKTVWINVDDLSTFSLTPADLGFSGAQTYLLTYYARPTATADPDLVIADNKFILSGDVKYNGKTYHMPGVEVTESVDLTEDTGYNAYKYAWYWYTDDQNHVLFDVAGYDKKTSEIIIGTRVSDPDYLMRFENMTYYNVADLYDANDLSDPDHLTHMEQSSANATLPIAETLDKQKVIKVNEEGNILNDVTEDGTWIEDTNGGDSTTNVCWFRLVANPNGEDLVKDDGQAASPNSYEIYDKLSVNMTLNPSSFFVLDHRTGEEVEFTLHPTSEQSFSITVPDEIPLDIIYSATVNALPNTDVSISNTASFDGTHTSPETIFIDEHFNYNFSTITVETLPTAKVIKMSIADAGTKLRGAMFSIEEYKLDENEQLIRVAEIDRGVTDGEGTLIFGLGDIHLKTDTIYCIREVKPPPGYMPDASPHYFVIAKRQANGKWLEYPSFLTNITIYELENGEHVYNKYDVPAGDPLPATGGFGVGTFCALSGSLLAVSLACLIVLLKKQKRSHPD